MDEIAMDGRDLEVSSNGGDWSVGWYPPPDPPPGTPHGAAAVCVSDDRVVLVSSDGQRWGLPGGRPEPQERWVDALRREVGEEACAVVQRARLLGFTRGVCVSGPEEGLVLVRSMWRAEVRPGAMGVALRDRPPPSGVGRRGAAAADVRRRADRRTPGKLTNRLGRRRSARR